MIFFYWKVAYRTDKYFNKDHSSFAIVVCQHKPVSLYKADIYFYRLLSIAF